MRSGFFTVLPQFIPLGCYRGLFCGLQCSDWNLPVVFFNLYLVAQTSYIAIALSHGCVSAIWRSMDANGFITSQQFFLGLHMLLHVKHSFLETKWCELKVKSSI